MLTNSAVAEAKDMVDGPVSGGHACLSHLLPNLEGIASRDQSGVLCNIQQPCLMLRAQRLSKEPQMSTAATVVCRNVGMPRQGKLVVICPIFTTEYCSEGHMIRKQYPSFRVDFPSLMTLSCTVYHRSLLGKLADVFRKVGYRLRNIRTIDSIVHSIAAGSFVLPRCDEQVIVFYSGSIPPS